MPSLKDEVVKDAVPLVRETFPRVFGPSLKVTVPDGIGEPITLPRTVALNVTGYPRLEGLGEPVR